MDESWILNIYRQQSRYNHDICTKNDVWYL